MVVLTPQLCHKSIFVSSWRVSLDGGTAGTARPPGMLWLLQTAAGAGREPDRDGVPLGPCWQLAEALA